MVKAAASGRKSKEKRFLTKKAYLLILAMMNNPLVAVDNLTVAFDGTPGVKGISFQLFPGELLAVVGESGSGKSLTALGILQLTPPSATVSGQIFFQEGNKAPLDLLSLNKKQMQSIRGNRIGMIFQEPMTSLNPVLTCGSQVTEAIREHQLVSAKEAHRQTVALFQKVKLPDPEQIMHRYPHELSGGQKQRVMIAMAICCNPSLLIADEPTTALDVTVQKSILELIKELQLQKGMSVLMVTHDLGLVADIADRVVVMYKGNIVEQGPAMELLRNPGNAYTKALLQCRPAQHPKGERLPVVEEKMGIRNEKAYTASSFEPATRNCLPVTRNQQPSLPVLQINNLCVHYPGKKSLFQKSTAPFKAVDGVSFTVSKGETVGLVGESGCGKTTLGRAILQLVPSSSGSIILNGQDVTLLSAKAMKVLRKELQIVFQDPYGSLNPRMTIGDAIVEPMEVHGMLRSQMQRREKVVELLEKVNLKADHFSRYPHQFSGGQRQRICIARALALHPSFLIFDESVSALDVSVQAQVLNLINDLKKELEFSSIFISHDLSVVRYISDRILVMRQGKIVEEGTADEIYFSPAQEYTHELIAAIPGKNLSSP